MGLFNGIGEMMGTRSPKPGPGSFNYTPPYPGAGQLVGSPTLPNGAWDDGPNGYYGPKGLGVGLKKGETMTIDPSSSQVLNPSLGDKAKIALSNFTQGKGFDTRTNPMPKLTFVGTDDPFAPKVYKEGDKGFKDYSRGTVKDGAGNPMTLPGGSAFDENGKAREDAFVKMPDSAYGYKGSAFGKSWDLTPQIERWRQTGQIAPGNPSWQAPPTLLGGAVPGAPAGR